LVGEAVVLATARRCRHGRKSYRLLRYTIDVRDGHKRPFASVEPHASFIFTNGHSSGQSSRRTGADAVDVGSLSVFEKFRDGRVAIAHHHVPETFRRLAPDLAESDDLIVVTNACW
jgi:hypothetical protein